MKRARFGPPVLACSIISVLLAGCGGSQPPIGAPGAITHGTVALSRAHNASGSYGDLLYVASFRDGVTVNTYTFPAGKRVGQFTLPVYSAYGMCSDNSGDVFITTVSEGAYSGTIFEYAYGGVTPIATLADGSHLPWGCSWDPTTGNLAVANFYSPDEGSGPNGNVAIYTQAQGSPTFYTDSAMSSYYNVAYDNQGSLFVTGQGDGMHDQLAEMPSGSDSFTNITVNKRVSRSPIAWDGAYLATMVGVPSPRGGARPKIIRLSIKGSRGIVEGATMFNGENNHPGASFSIYGGNVAVPLGEAEHKYSFGIYPYPGGGNPNVVVGKQYRIQSMTIAVDPSRSRIHR